MLAKLRAQGKMNQLRIVPHLQLQFGKDALANAGSPARFVAAPPRLQPPQRRCISNLPVSASLAPLLAHPQKTLANCGAFLYKELIDGNWQSYLVSLAPVAVAVGVSYQLCVGLEGEIQVAVLRSFAQMLSLGLLLKFMFEGHALWSILGILIMVILAGSTAGEQSKELPKSQVVATASLAFGTLGTVALLVFLGVLPSEPSSLIVVTGHMLGNAMIMVGRTLKALQYEIAQHTGQIEAALALGAAPYCSVQSYIRQAFVFGMTPMVDAIKVMGLVSLPGNMTGLLIGGAVPLEAVKTQIKLMNAVLGAAAISSLIATLLGWHMLFTSTFQLQER